MKSSALRSAIPGPQAAPAEAVNGDSPDATMCFAISSLVSRFAPPPLQSTSAVPPSPDCDGDEAALFFSDVLEFERCMDVDEGEVGVIEFVEPLVFTTPPFACETGLRDSGGTPFSTNEDGNSNCPALLCRLALPERKLLAKSSSRPVFGCMNDCPKVDAECVGTVEGPHDDELEGDEAGANPPNPNVSNVPRLPLMLTGLTVGAAADVGEGVSGVSANDISQGLLAIVRYWFGGGSVYWPNGDVE